MVEIEVGNLKSGKTSAASQRVCVSIASASEGIEDNLFSSEGCSRDE